MRIISREEKDISMQEEPRVLDVSDEYPFCVDCKQVLVAKVFKEHDYVPLCYRCRKERNKCRKEE